ncbi:MAG TPA: FAD:protein FMN transferase [Candidatus Saccharimonadales bacterium]|nr:FAD:protein FMN transferase [Candidatus Saccharimonadales bacterium]
MTRSTKSKTKRKVSLTFEAIGTQWAIDLTATPEQAAGLLERLLVRIDEFDKAYSRFRADSLVSSMSQTAGRYALPEDAQPLMALYWRMYQATEGAVTPLIGQVLSDAGYDAKYSFAPGPMRAPSAWEEAMEVRGRTVYLKQPALLDFGAAGKGYLVDIVASLIEVQGIRSYCVDAGGDIRYRSANGKYMRIGLEHPDNPRQVIGVASLSSGRSLCGSAGNRRKWAEYHHIMHPHTLRSPTTIKAVWVAAGTALLADGMATCLFFVPPEQLFNHGLRFAYVILYEDGTVLASRDFPGELFTATK